MEKLKIPEWKISLIATGEGDDIKGGLVTADVICEEEMAQCEGHTSAGIFIHTWLATADMD